MNIYLQLKKKIGGGGEQRYDTCSTFMKVASSGISEIPWDSN
jgi:hypothetical protein